MSDNTEFRYRIVDVFTRTPLEGNALAVFPDAEGLAEARLQPIAREFNLSETVFVFPATRPECAAQLRIFTPAKEMVFAGHPTVGTSFVLWYENFLPVDTTQFQLDLRVGPVPVRIDLSDAEAPLFWLTTPPIADGPQLDPKVCAQVLGVEPGDLLPIPPQLLSAGNPTIFIALRDREAVDRASLDVMGMRRLVSLAPEAGCVFVFTPVETGAYSRMFAPEYGIIEDPATGSSTGPLAAYMLRHGLVRAQRCISEQGTKMGRRSLLHIQHHPDGRIEVGGHVTTIAEGVLRI